MQLSVLSWNLFHGRDSAPDPALHTWRSRLLRIDERNATHLQVNRDLLAEFAGVLARAEWDVAALQESPPRWGAALARATGAEAHAALTARNSLGILRALLAQANPDLIASNEGGSNLTLARPAAGGIVERRELELRREPERRALALTRLRGGPCVANLHASVADPLAAEEVVAAARSAVDWAGGKPVVLAGDFNVRPDDSGVFAELADLGFTSPSDGRAIDHILVRGLDVIEPARAWAATDREVREEGLAIRLSDHAPVQAIFGTPPQAAA
jgi:endonuclease/exonuclease/phosphatase family metal-dependent hydrolase